MLSASHNLLSAPCDELVEQPRLGHETDDEVEVEHGNQCFLVHFSFLRYQGVTKKVKILQNQFVTNTLFFQYILMAPLEMYLRIT